MALLAMSRLAAMRRLPLVTSPAWRGLADSARKPAKDADAAAEAAGKPADSTAEPESGTLQETAAEPDVEAAPDSGAEPGTGAVQEGGAEPAVRAKSYPKRWQDYRYSRRSTWSEEPTFRFLGPNYPLTADQFNEAVRSLALERHDYVAAKKLYDDMIALGHIPSPKAYGPLISTAAFRGKAQDVRAMYKLSKEMGFYAAAQDYFRLIKCYKYTSDPASALMIYEHLKAQFVFADSEIVGLLLEVMQTHPLSARRAKTLVAELEAKGSKLRKRGALAAMNCAVLTKDVKFGRELYERYEGIIAKWQYAELICTAGDSNDFKQMQEKIGPIVQEYDLQWPREELLFAIYHARQGDAAKAVGHIKTHIERAAERHQINPKFQLRHDNDFMQHLGRCKDCKDVLLDYVEFASSKGFKLYPRHLQIIISVMIDAGDVPHAKEYAEEARKFSRMPEYLHQLLDIKYKYFIMRTTNADAGAADLGI